MNVHSAIILAAFLALIASPYLFRRFSRPGTNVYGAFAVGARDFGWFRICAGLSATFVGGAAVINLAGLGYTYGWFGLADVLPTSLALLISAVVIVPQVFRRRGISLGGFLQVSGTLVNAATGLLSTVVYTLITAAQIVALIKVAQPYFAVPVPVLATVATAGIAGYLLYGGYNSVTVTDVIQFVVMDLCYFGLIGFTLWLAPAAASAAAAIPAKVMPLDYVLLLALPLLFVPVSQDLHIRINSAPRPASARVGVLLAGGVYLVFGLISVTIGRALAQAGTVLPSPDDAVPTFLRQHFGAFAIVPTIAVICVVVSTLDSVLFAAASSLSYDFWDRLTRNARQKDSAHPRIATLLVLGLALIIALQASAILQLVLSAMVIYVAVLLPMLVGRLLNRSSRALGLVAFAVLAGVIALEAVAFAPPFRAFAYTLGHLVFVLCLKKESSP